MSRVRVRSRPSIWTSRPGELSPGPPRGLGGVGTDNVKDYASRSGLRLELRKLVAAELGRSINERICETTSMVSSDEVTPIR